MKAFAVSALLVLAGCFDSIVSDRCSDGYSYEGGQCVASGDDAPDGGVTVGGDGSGSDGEPGHGHLHPEAVHDTGLVCEAPEVLCAGACTDVTIDPDNCGTCGHVCATGLCSAGKCVGELEGHIVAIGHDYRHHHAAMARVLGNAVALGHSHDLAVARWRGTSAAQAVTGTTQALTQGLQQIGRPWHSVMLAAEPSSTALDGIDVLLVDAQTGDGDATEAAAAAWAEVIDGFLARGGVVVVLEGAGGTSYRFAAGAGLYTVGAPVDETDHQASIAVSTDAVAQQVPTPYLAEGDSVALVGGTAPIITSDDGQPLVLHVTR